jgi:heme/copper-type cytochrome/quinol oxidase subunit 4
MTIINQFIFICLFAGCFFVPGWLVLNALNLRPHRFLLSFSLSYVLLIITVTALQVAKLPTSCFAPFILGGSVVFGALWLARFARIRYFRDEQNRSFRSRPGILIPFAAVMGLLWVYLWWVGPYLEIPSDAWNHVGFFRNAQAQINAGRFGEAAPSPYGSFVCQGNDWYLIIAYLMRWSGISMPRVLTPLTVMTVSTFCAGIFFCALAVFRPFRVSIWKRGWMAAGSALFCAATMGTSVFAYIRYYALAPTILNYLLFLSATLIALDWLNIRKWWTNAVWLIPALILTMNVVHGQEVLFTCFMIMGLALVNIARGLIGSRRNKPDASEAPRGEPRGIFAEPCEAKDAIPSCGILRCQGNGGQEPQGFLAKKGVLSKTSIEGAAQSILFAKSLIVAGIAIGAWLGLFYWLRHSNPIIWPTAHTIMPNMPTPAVVVPLVFKALTISPPAHPVVRLVVYQFYTFYQTIGCWGLFVYIAFLLGFRQMVKSNYLLAGMASPLLTVFNPITIDLFVRLITLQLPGVSPVTIVRFNYMLPLPFVAAFALGSAVESLTRRAGRPGAESCGRRSKAALIKAAIIVIGLVGLIFPIHNRWVDAPFSRLYTLSKHFGNDVERWKDLTDFAAGFQNPVLITDPNTGLIFSRLYPEYSSCGLQWMDSNEPETHFLEAVKRQPELRTRGIVIINRRDGIPSVTGRISKHWPEDAFLTSRFYSPKAIAFVESHTNCFKLLWAKDRIEVFKIIP